jgi:hypothetical protein
LIASAITCLLWISRRDDPTPMRPHLASPHSSVCDGHHKTSDLTGALAYKLVRGSEIFPLMSAWGKRRNTLKEQMFSAVAPATDIADP